MNMTRSLLAYGPKNAYYQLKTWLKWNENELKKEQYLMRQKLHYGAVLIGHAWAAFLTSSTRPPSADLLIE